MIYETLVILDGKYENKTIEAISVDDAMKKLEELYGKTNVPFVPYKIDLVG